MRYSTKFKIFLFFIVSSIIFASCVPIPSNNTPSNASKKNSGKRSENRNQTANSSSKSTDKSNSEINTANEKKKEDISKLAEKAVNSKNNKATTSRNKKNDQYTNRKDKLKDVVDEKDRFIDTTYYILTMENGETKINNEVSLSGGKNNKEYYEKLITEFDNAVNSIKKSPNSLDCAIFKEYANQLYFNDSLQQEALYNYSECCINNDDIDEAINTLEPLSKEKLNYGVAPKIIVRIGQLYCLKGDTKQAQKYFRKLKKEFPRSIYNQLADCSKL